MKPISIIYGTRPEAIKMAPIIKEFKNRGVVTRVISTGQHQDLLTDIEKDLAITPDIRLSCFKDGSSLSSLLARVINGLEPHIADSSMVIVQGDTTSALGGAIACMHSKIPLAHVEAGLRSGDINSPHPEEGNRLLIDSISDICFAPTKEARDVLIKEGKNPKSVFLTGNTEVDSVLSVFDMDYTLAIASNYHNIVVTLHRRENFDRAPEIAKELASIGNPYNILVISHPNPTGKRFKEALLAENASVIFLPPVGFKDMVNLVGKSWLVLTDSGGLVEDCLTLHVPCGILRTETERMEAVKCGGAELVLGKVARFVSRLQVGKNHIEMAACSNPFGDGFAAKRIVEKVIEAVSR